MIRCHFSGRFFSQIYLCSINPMKNTRCFTIHLITYLNALFIHKKRIPFLS